MEAENKKIVDSFDAAVAEFKKMLVACFDKQDTKALDDLHEIADELVNGVEGIEAYCGSFCFDKEDEEDCECGGVDADEVKPEEAGGGDVDEKKLEKKEKKKPEKKEKPPCDYVFKQGPNSGKPCGMTATNGSRCSKHKVR